jgi:predicted HTH domain antitoxin
MMLYKKNKLSIGKAANLADMDKLDFTLSFPRSSVGMHVSALQRRVLHPVQKNT